MHPSTASAQYTRRDPQKIARAARAQHQPQPKPGRGAVAARRAGARRGEYARNRYVHLYGHFADSHLKYRVLREVCDLFRRACARGDRRAASCARRNPSPNHRNPRRNGIHFGGGGGLRTRARVRSRRRRGCEVRVFCAVSFFLLLLGFFLCPLHLFDLFVFGTREFGMGLASRAGVKVMGAG